MRSKLSVFLILCLLAVQGFSAMHMADYGVLEHEHHGHVCDVYLHGEQSQSSDCIASVTFAIPHYNAYAVSSPSALLLRQRRYHIASPRAPPVFS